VVLVEPKEIPLILVVAVVVVYCGMQLAPPQEAARFLNLERVEKDTVLAVVRVDTILARTILVVAALQDWW
jgi:hypothetical protein